MSEPRGTLDGASPALPKVSCLMVTSYAPERREFLARSLESYCRQTYPNRELVVVPDCAPNEQQELAQALADLGRADTFVSQAVEGQSLGALRNLSLERATGALVCQWDDDDLYHPRRVEVQAQPLRDGAAQASILGRHFNYFQQERRMLLIDWRGALFKGHPGTLMMRRDLGLRYPVSGPFSRRSEDSSLFQQLLRRRVAVAVIDTAPELYVYRFHGANTWAREHHLGLVARHGSLRAELAADELQLAAGLRDVFLEEDSVSVEGSDGPAFRVALQGKLPRPQCGARAAESVA